MAAQGLRASLRNCSSSTIYEKRYSDTYFSACVNVWIAHMYCLQVYKMNVSKMGSVIELLLLHGLVHGAVLVAPLHISSSSAVRYLVYPAVEPSVLIYISGQLLVGLYLVLLLQLHAWQSRALSIVDPSTWNGLLLEVRLLLIRIMKMRFASYLSLVSAWLGWGASE